MSETETTDAFLKRKEESADYWAGFGIGPPMPVAEMKLLLSLARRGAAIPDDLLAEIDRLKAEINMAYERAAQAKPVESETHLLQDSGYTRGWTNCNRAKSAAIRNLKEPT
jgi:hypothetical protein